MKYKINRSYKQNANRFTFGLITLVMLGFGAVAQSEESKIGKPQTSISSWSICQSIAPSLCDQLDQVQAQANHPLFLIQ